MCNHYCAIASHTLHVAVRTPEGEDLPEEDVREVLPTEKVMDGLEPVVLTRLAPDQRDNFQDGYGEPLLAAEIRQRESVFREQTSTALHGLQTSSVCGESWQRLLVS